MRQRGKVHFRGADGLGFRGLVSTVSPTVQGSGASESIGSRAVGLKNNANERTIDRFEQFASLVASAVKAVVPDVGAAHTPGARGTCRARRGGLHAWRGALIGGRCAGGGDGDGDEGVHTWSGGIIGGRCAARKNKKRRGAAAQLARWYYRGQVCS